jgi:hypothetical protein
MNTSEGIKYSLALVSNLQVGGNIKGKNWIVGEVCASFGVSRTGILGRL